MGEENKGEAKSLYMMPIILNISDLENCIRYTYHQALDLAKEVDSDELDIKKVQRLTRLIVAQLSEARYFDFILEYRKSYCE